MSIISATPSDNYGNFNIMYCEGYELHLLAIKWYASIYKVKGGGYHIKHPSNLSLTNLKIIDIFITNVDNPYINEETLYVPITTSAVEKCLELWVNSMNLIRIILKKIKI